MSRFANPTAVETADLGACQCPGTPHDHDSATYRVELGGSAIGRIGMASLRGAAGGDPLSGHRAVVAEAVVSWTLLWPDPTADVAEGAERPVVPVPISDAAIAELDEDTLRSLTREIDSHVRTRAPNARGGRSQDGSPAKRSRTPRPSRRPTT